MDIIFYIMAVLSVLSGLAQFYYFMQSYPSLLQSVIWLFSGLTSMVSSYAWITVGDMWEKQQKLEQKISLKQ